MHYVINFKISHGRAKYSCRCPINRKLCDMVFCTPKKHAVFFFPRVINVTLIFQVILYFKCGMIFSCCVNKASSRPKRNVTCIICCVLVCMEYVTGRDLPNQYADGVKVGLCDTRDNIFSTFIN